jgi:hypothetical protein
MSRNAVTFTLALFVLGLDLVERLIRLELGRLS